MSPEVSGTIFSTAGPLVPVHCRVVVSVAFVNKNYD